MTICRKAGRTFWAWETMTAVPAPRNSTAMAGTSFSLTLPTRPMPPKITAPVQRAVTTPMINRSQPKAAWRAAEMELDWTKAPPEREASTAQRENQPAAPFQPSRRER